MFILFSIFIYFYVAASQSLSHVWLFATPWTRTHQPPLSFAISQPLLSFISIESAMLSNHLILCHPLFLLPSFSPNIRVSTNESTLHIRWPKYWSFSNSPSNEYSGLISFRVDWFDPLVHSKLERKVQYRDSTSTPSPTCACALGTHIPHQTVHVYNDPALTHQLACSPVGSTLVFRPTDCVIINGCCFKPLNLC